MSGDDDLTYDEIRQAELGLVVRLTELQMTPPRRRGSHYDHHLATTKSAIAKLLAQIERRFPDWNKP